MKNETLLTSISKDEFVGRFYENIVAESLRTHLYSHDRSCYIGKIENNNFYFYYKPAYVKNSFTTILRGKINEQDGACTISYRFTKLFR